MTRKFYVLVCTLLLAFGPSAVRSYAQIAATSDSVAESSLNAVVTIRLAADGQSNPVGSGLIVRSDGYILVPFSLVRGSREIQVRLRNGETYDKAEIVSTDERRNVAILRINAVGLSYIPSGTTEESQVGSKIFVVASPTGQSVVNADLMLNAVQMADSVQGAGKGYRLLQFNSIDGMNPTGGLLLDGFGRSLGIVTTTPDIKGHNIAVPLSSILGMIRSVPLNNVTASSATISSYPAVPAPTPYVIPQSSVIVPQRGVTPLSAKGPGSAVVKPTTVPEILALSKTVHVTSRTISFKPDQLVNELNKRKEINEWGMSFVDEEDLADLILEIDHVLLTWKYTFKLYSQRLGTIVATGSVVILDGNVGAPAMAERVIEKLKTARGPEKATSKVVPDVKAKTEKMKIL